jgi:hypothetical protein
MAIPSSRSIYTNAALMVRRCSGQTRAKMMRQPGRRAGRPILGALALNLYDLRLIEAISCTGLNRRLGRGRLAYDQ